MLPHLSRLTLNFWVKRGTNHALLGSDVILLFSFDSTPHPPENMDYPIDPIKRPQLDPHFNELFDYIDKTIQTPPDFGFLMKIQVTSYFMYKA